MDGMDGLGFGFVWIALKCGIFCEGTKKDPPNKTGFGFVLRREVFSARSISYWFLAPWLLLRLGTLGVVAGEQPKHLLRQPPIAGEVKWASQVGDPDPRKLPSFWWVEASSFGGHGLTLESPKLSWWGNVYTSEEKEKNKGRKKTLE